MEKIVFNEFYSGLLQPSPTFDNRGRYEKCRYYWNSIDEAEQSAICKIIRQKRTNGEYVNPNPCFAMNDAMQDYENRLAKSQAHAVCDPLNYNGHPGIISAMRSQKLVCAQFRGQYGIYTLDDAKAFNMHIARGINFQYQTSDEHSSNG